MSRKKPVKITAKAEALLLEQLASGASVSEACRKFPAQLPNPTAFYRHSAANAEFREKLDSAYTIWLELKMDELDDLSNRLASEVYPDHDWREAEATMKRRIDSLKFMLGKMAPVLSKRFDKAAKLELSGANIGNQIAVINYYSDEAKPLNVLDNDS